MIKSFKIKLFLLFSVFIILFITRTYASSISISASKTTVSPNENVTITVNASDVVGRIDMSGGDISPINAWIENNSISFTAKAPSSGSMTITATPFEPSNSLGEDATVASKSITINVVSQEATQTQTPQQSQPEAKSGEARLANLGIKPNDFSGFKRDKTDYSVEVPNNVSSVTVYASPVDANAKVSGTGKINLNEGTNLAKVTVTAQNGATKTYKITITRQVISGEIVPNSSDGEVGENELTVGLSKLELKGLELSQKFASNVYKYEVKVDKKYTLNEIKELISAEVNFEGGKFEIITQNDFDLEKNNEVMISVKDSDGREIAVYTLVFKMNSIADTSDTSNTAGIIGENDEDKLEFDKEKLLIIGTIGIISIIAVVFGVVSYKQRKMLVNLGIIKKKKDDFQEKLPNDNNEENVKDIVEESKQETEDNNYVDELFKEKSVEFNTDENDYIKKRGRHFK